MKRKSKKDRFRLHIDCNGWSFSESRKVTQMIYTVYTTADQDPRATSVLKCEEDHINQSVL